MSETWTLPPAAMDILAQTDFFAGLTPRQLHALSSISRLQEYAEGP